MKDDSMQKFLFVTALLIGSQSVHASHLITEISFSGKGLVTSSDGINAPLIGETNNIKVLISFKEMPYIDEKASGTFNLYKLWGTTESGFQDSFTGTLLCQSYCSGQITLYLGKLVDFKLVSIFFDEEILQLRPNQFSGFFLSHNPIEANNYAGNWDMGPVRITTDAIPEPANWALMIAGFALVGCTVRARRTARQDAIPA